MDSQQDTQQPNVSTTSTKRTRRVWRKVEEDALMKVLVNEVSDKWSGENGFRPGFFTFIAKELEKLLPDSHIKASPHIDSKVKYWRQMYHKISDIVALSGFGWDDVNKRVDVEQSVWDEFEKAHPKKAKEVYGKQFPYFEDWVIVFGKDRATRALAEDPTQIEESIPPTPIEKDIGLHGDVGGGEGDFYEPLFDEQFLNSPYANMGHTPMRSTSCMSTALSSPNMGSPTMGSTPLGSTSTNLKRRMSIPTSTTPPANYASKKGKKRTRMGDEEDIRGSMGMWCEKSLVTMEKMANALGYEKEISARRSTIPGELEKLNLTLTQQFKMAAIIGEKDERVDQFLNTRDDRRQAWCEAVLNGHVFG